MGFQIIQHFFAIFFVHVDAVTGSTVDECVVSIGKHLIYIQEIITAFVTDV